MFKRKRKYENVEIDILFSENERLKKVIASMQLELDAYREQQETVEKTIEEYNNLIAETKVINEAYKNKSKLLDKLTKEYKKELKTLNKSFK